MLFLIILHLHFAKTKWSIFAVNSGFSFGAEFLSNVWGASIALGYMTLKHSLVAFLCTFVLLGLQITGLFFKLRHLCSAMKCHWRSYGLISFIVRYETHRYIIRPRIQTSVCCWQVLIKMQHRQKLLHCSTCDFCGFIAPSPLLITWREGHFCFEQYRQPQGCFLEVSFLFS